MANLQSQEAGYQNYIPSKVGKLSIPTSDVAMEVNIRKKHPDSKDRGHSAMNKGILTKKQNSGD